MIWWSLALLPVAYFFQLCVHEASHLLVGWINEGRKPLGFYPYPHVHDGKWYFARCKMGPADPTTLWHPSLCCLPRHIAPFYAGMITAGAAWLAMHWPWSLPLIVTGVGDALWWWRGYLWGSQWTDGKRWRNGDVWNVR